MATPTNNTGGSNRDRIAALIAQYNGLPSSTGEERNRRDAVLDELQEAVGLAGRMVTEKDILRQAKTLLAG